MKKTLLCTTAIAATGFAGMANAVEVAAGAVNLNISGFFTANLGAASVDGTSTNGQDFDGVDVHTNTEIHFKPSITMDNGITVGAHIELEGNAGSGAGATTDTIDESYIWAKGDFGELVVGSENSAGYKLQIAAPDVSLVGVNSGSLTAFVPYSSGTAAGTGANGVFRGVIGTTYLENARNNDAERITYFTPNFAGFKAGISYARDAGQGSTPVDTTSVVSDFFDIGASYNGTIGPVDLGISARYGVADGGASTGQDPEVFGVGLNLGIAGFTIGGSYADQDEAGALDGEAWDLGVSYSQGPWSASITYFEGKSIDDDAPTFTEELQQIIGAVTYSLNSNLRVSAFIADVNFDEQAVSGDQVEGTVFGIGTRFSF